LLASQWFWDGPEVLKHSFLSSNNVTFLNQKASIFEKTVWNDKYHEKLWLYNLHYFDDLNAINSLSRKDIQYSLIKRWIKENPPAKGNGWEPYPISLRLINWIKWYTRSEIFDQTMINSIELQAQALYKQLEFHILGNHLFANAKALIFVGCFLEGQVGDKYLQLGLKILDREITEQFLDDGGHFERSPMYHSILLWDLLDLINLARLSSRPKLLIRVQKLSHTAVKALIWLDEMIHNDGEISFFNDSCIGIAASPSELKYYSNTLGLVSTHKKSYYKLLSNSGYSCITYPAYKLIFDHGEIGPSYLPGHAHADTLSFEMSVGCNRFFVNSGTSLYGVSKERHRQRGTQAHNTVIVDGANSSEVWGGFRVARRANVVSYNASFKNEMVIVSAKHNGYFRLGYNIMHSRIITASPYSLTIKDNISDGTYSAYANFHLHPKVCIKIISENSLELNCINGSSLIFKSTGLIKVVESTYHPNFGVKIKNKCISILLQNNSLEVSLLITKE
jgi:uncharacterized heparinase superfamily protein